MGVYYQDDIALKGFDPTPYNTTIPAPNPPEGSHGFAIYSAGDDGKGQDPLVSWDGVIDVINNRLLRDYKMVFNTPAAGGGAPVTKTSDMGSIVSPGDSDLLQHVGKNHIVTKQDILDARDKIRQYGLYQRFQPLDRRLTKQMILDLLKYVPLYLTLHGSSGGGGTFGGGDDNTLYDESAVLATINTYTLERISDGKLVYFYGRTSSMFPDATVMTGAYPLEDSIDTIINRWAKEDMFADDTSPPVVRWKVVN